MFCRKSSKEEPAALGNVIVDGETFRDSIFALQKTGPLNATSTRSSRATLLFTFQKRSTTSTSSSSSFRLTMCPPYARARTAGPVSYLVPLRRMKSAIDDRRFPSLHQTFDFFHLFPFTKEVGGRKLLRILSRLYIFSDEKFTHRLESTGDSQTTPAIIEILLQRVENAR